MEQLKHSITTFLQQALDDLRAELAQQLQNSSSFWATLLNPQFHSDATAWRLTTRALWPSPETPLEQ
jgi:hypothetical protein